MNPSLACGSLFMTYTAAVFMHSAQKHGGTFLACSMLLHVSARCRFFLCATSFCWGML